MTLKIASTRRVLRRVNPAPVIRLPELRSDLLPLFEALHRSRKGTDTLSIQSVERNVNIDKIGWMAYVKLDGFLEAPALGADVSRAEKPDGGLFYEQLRLWEAAFEVLHEVQAVWAPT